jgi:hypothetical protein
MRQDAKRLDEPRHRQAAIIRQQAPSACAKMFAAQSHHFGAGIQTQNLSGQRAGVKIARRLTARNQDP